MGADGTGDRLILGDCLEVLRTLPDASVDAIVTDPPAGISFMGAAWDHHKGGRAAWIAWLAAVMREGLRVLKAGGHALVWALPRTSHWTATALEDAGFEVRDVLVHVFGSGFPKSLDVSKAIDAMAGAEREKVRPVAVPRRCRNGTAALGGGWQEEPWETAPATAEPQQWRGFGTALKPAQEHWILCRKPLAVPTVAGQVLATGTGALNIDGCRIAPLETARVPSPAGQGATHFLRGMLAGGRGHDAGRWPPNFLLTHSAACDDVCAPDCPVAEMDRQSGQSVSRAGGMSGSTFSAGSAGQRGVDPRLGHDDEGGASRFFPTFRGSTEGVVPATAPWSPENTIAATPRFRYQAKPSTSERTRGLADGQRPIHPTVKGVDLMRWLCRLVTPPGGVVLDMFAGSGTTGVAAIAEGLHFLGIEQEQEYYAIAHSRLEHVLTTPVQRGLFAEVVQA